MIRSLKEVTEKELSSLEGKFVSIEEKIDAPYYSAIIENQSVIVRKSNGSELNIVDFTLNDINNEVVSFFIDVANEINDKNKYNIGIFYFPTDKPRSTTYKNFEKKFMISHMEIENNGIMEKIEYPETFLKSFNISVLSKPVIFKKIMEKDDIEKIRKYKKGIYGEMMLCQKLFGSNIAASKLSSSDGYIFRFPHSNYKVQLNQREELTDSVERKMYRDIILKDFTNWFITNKIQIPQKTTFITTVAIIFSIYIKSTDIMSRYDLEPEYLTPPCIGYVGDLCTKFISNEDALNIIKSDEISKCIFKILLSALDKGIKKKKDDILTDKIVLDFNNISHKIKTEAF